jgi:transcriptional regulator with XRE-family HTH domain/Zn-dependent peptidase ImmA (M78 family)
LALLQRPLAAALDLRYPLCDNRTVDSRDLASRIAEYRLRAGLSQQNLAQRAGLDRTALAKIENGQRRVTALELSAIAQALDVRIEWFFRPPAEALVAYRSALAPEAPTASIDQVIERLSRDADFVWELAPLRFPELRGGKRDLESRSSAETFATEVRSWMGLSPREPIMGLAERAARTGTLIFSFDLGPDAPEAASVVGSRTGVAVVNGHLRVGRRRLAAAHELGHMLTRDGYRVDWRIDRPDQETWETRLDQFARALLLPEQPVRAAWTAQYDGSYREAAIRIGSEFQVDMATLARRLLDLRLATDAEAALVRNVSTSKADIISLDLMVRNDLEPPSAPRLYQQVILDLYQADTITASRAIDLLAGTFVEADLPARPTFPEAATWSVL